MTKSEKAVKEAVRKFYYEHHDHIEFEANLVTEIDATRLRTFTEIKHQVVDAIDARIDNYTATQTFRNGYNSNMLEELRKLRNYVKGMVIQIDEPSESEDRDPKRV